MIEVKSVAGKDLPHFDGPISQPYGHSPPRRPGSVRRTSSITATWPYGMDGDTEMRGTSRDFLTQSWGVGRTIAQDCILAVAAKRKIVALSCEPPRAGIGGLVGATAGGQLRAAIADALPDELKRGTPLYLLLDDLAGATLVAGWSFSLWPQPERARPKPARQMSGICIGFRPGSSALTSEGTSRPSQNISLVVPLQHPGDPDGWHDMPDPGGLNFRRARRIDLWHGDDGLLQIDAGFQDSANSPSGQRTAIHEYHVTATCDEAGRLLSIKANPGTLPFAECRAAPTNIDDLIGVPMSELRREVLLRLHKTFGCTHLNDTLRALAEVPVLAASLERAGQ